jgi:hypothetical protein
MPKWQNLAFDFMAPVMHIGSIVKAKDAAGVQIQLIFLKLLLVAVMSEANSEGVGLQNRPRTL